MSARSIGRLASRSSALFLCDMQEKFRPSVAFFPQIVAVAARMLQSTALDLLERGLDVHVVADACSSRSQVDRLIALSRMKQSGAFLTTSEGTLLQLVQDAKHPKFREVQKIITEPAPDSNLVALFQGRNPIFG
ncbi:isochorismatase domain-containing protein 2 isoform X2 [Heterodontus francisci]|uniref:isochorismatase domain-containing protein 2 isoform X2 n=1 Tax=Heterodontus francisci TaxID=7792 RepID=UPI00355C4FF7